MTKIMVDEEEYKELKAEVKSIDRRLIRLVEILAYERLGLTPPEAEDDKSDETE